MKCLPGLGLLCAVMAAAVWIEDGAETRAPGSAPLARLDTAPAGRVPPRHPPQPPRLAAEDPVAVEHGVEVRYRPQSPVLGAERESAAADEARDSELAPAEPVPPAPAREPPPPAHLSDDSTT